MHRLHPVQVEYTYHIGSRIDAEWEYPPSLEGEDLEDVLDLLSSPPNFVERIAPLSFQLGPETISAKNPSEATAKFLRHFQRMLHHVSGVVHQVSRVKFRERSGVAFLGLSLCPETIRRTIEFDYEHADNTYSRLVALMSRGDVCPVATIPFHILLPLMDEFETRLLIRMGLAYYWPLLRAYNRAVRKKLGEEIFCVVIVLPEGGFTRKALEFLHTELQKLCEQDKIAKSHLVLLLDTGQVRERESDILMKRWHAIRPTNSTRDHVSILFRDRTFMQWVVEGHPSVKKMLDRTIAKVDATLRDAGIDYLWSHFEPLESLMSTHKTATNFQQKLIKLTELGYQPLSPDAFVRRKLLGTFAREEQEPRRCNPLDNTTWNGWDDSPNGLSRWEGMFRDSEGQPQRLEQNRPYLRRDGKARPIQEPGAQCWKPALWRTLRTCQKAVIGETRTFLGGMLQLLRETVPIERIPVQRRNVEDFLVRCSQIHWREHFIQTEYSEADIQLREFVDQTLLTGCPEGAEITDEGACVAGMAARAVFFSYEALRSMTFVAENFDQRATYESAAMMTLAIVHAMQAYLWAGKRDEALALLEVLKRELHDFQSAFERHDLAQLGVSRAAWNKAIQSEVEDSDLDVVARASRRVAAIHLRKMGFRKECKPGDELLTTASGHFWSLEIDRSNLQWENPAFCGLAEE